MYYIIATITYNRLFLLRSVSVMLSSCLWHQLRLVTCCVLETTQSGGYWSLKSSYSKRRLRLLRIRIKYLKFKRPNSKTEDWQEKHTTGLNYCQMIGLNHCRKAFSLHCVKSGLVTFRSSLTSYTKLKLRVGIKYAMQNLCMSQTSLGFT